MNQIIKEDLEVITNYKLNWTDFKDRTILITGINGLLPSYLVRTLLFLNDLNPDFNIHVIGLARNKEKVQNKLNDCLDRSDFKILYQDVCDPINIDYSIDYIIHAASQASPKYFGIDPVGTLKANVIGTYNLLELARTQKLLGFLFFSSGEVYGNPNEKDLPLKETFNGNVNTLSVRSCYAESKRMGENMCISWYSQYNIPCKIVRPFHIYGPGVDLNDKRVWADFVDNIIQGKDIIMKSDGTATRSFCYIADATVAFFLIILKGINGEAYNVGGEHEISVLELAQRIVNLFPSKHLKIVKMIENRDNKEYFQSLVSRIYPDITKIKKLGWCPEHSIEQGFKRTIDSLKF